MVGDNTADEAGVRVAERGHEAAQGLLVELSHRPEHSPARAAAGGAVPKAAHLLQPHDALHYVKRKADVGKHGIRSPLWGARLAEGPGSYHREEPARYIRRTSHHLVRWVLSASLDRWAN